MPNRIREFVFWSQPRRRYVIRFTAKIGRRSKYRGRLYGWLLDQLYPDDAGVSFK